MFRKVASTFIEGVDGVPFTLITTFEDGTPLKGGAGKSAVRPQRPARARPVAAVFCAAALIDIRSRFSTSQMLTSYVHCILLAPSGRFAHTVTAEGSLPLDLRDNPRAIPVRVEAEERALHAYGHCKSGCTHARRGFGLPEANTGAEALLRPASRTRLTIPQFPQMVGWPAKCYRQTFEGIPVVGEQPEGSDRATGYPSPVCQLSGSNVEFPHTGCDCHCSREWLAHPAPPVPKLVIPCFHSSS
jgi:hypothetical protein